MNTRRKTYFIDIDGVILLKSLNSGATAAWAQDIKLYLCPGVKSFFDAIEKEGAAIVLVTARRESCRAYLESELRRLGLFWDHLLTGLGNGTRILINDSMNPEENITADSLCIKTNKGFE